MYSTSAYCCSTVTCTRGTQETRNPETQALRNPGLHRVSKRQNYQPDPESSAECRLMSPQSSIEKVTSSPREPPLQ